MDNNAKRGMNPMKLSHRQSGSPFPCPICLSESVKETLSVREMTTGTRATFNYAICATCESAYILDFPANIADYYKGYYSFEDAIPTVEKSVIKQKLIAVYSAVVVRPDLSWIMRGFFRCPGPREMKVLSPNLQAFLFVGAKADAHIVDVGSGRGEFVKMMRRFGYKNAVGIDPFLDKGFSNEYVEARDIYSLNRL